MKIDIDQHETNFNLIIHNSILSHFKNPLNFNSLYFPALSIPISSDGTSEIVLNCFFPRIDRKINITQNSIHHHGKIRLTSTVIFGGGYRHLIFSHPLKISNEKNEFILDVLSDKLHFFGEKISVDPFVPHAVMAPQDLTITYAVWENKMQQNFISNFRKIAQNSIYLKPLSKFCINTLRSLKIKKFEFFDFYPGDSFFIGMEKRLQFSKLSNIAYAHQLCYLLKKIDDVELVKKIQEIIIKNKKYINNFDCYVLLLENILLGRQIDLYCSKITYQHLSHMMFSLDDIYNITRKIKNYGGKL